MSWNSEELMKAVRDRRVAREKTRRNLALVRAQRVAEMLKREYGVSKVLLYGSLAEGYFHETSDIDLLIDDHIGSYWNLLVEAEKIASPFVLSIVCAKDAQASLLETAEARGISL